MNTSAPDTVCDLVSVQICRHSRDTVNPLRTLCHQLGLSPAVLADELKISTDTVASALSLNPDPALEAFLRITALIHAKIRVEAAPLPGFWVSTSAIDALFTDNDWRQREKMCPCPQTILGVMKIIETQRDRGMVRPEIAAYLNRHFIPTADGAAIWTAAAVLRLLPAGGRKPPRRDPVPVPASPAMLLRWRRHVCSMLLCRIFPDLAGAVRWGLLFGEDGERTIFRGTKPVPAVIADQMLVRFRRLGWFRDRWGMI